mmetsp:Transcript_10741/g.14218  ORF Transcript_10741/g.14218 Transcript_10741/m.14218 type:complete len:505 (-) Transcript_10741:135-1649(-)|eukprot:CAMPEP_0198141800 /NCGR_PEP_ID=MMETSP1443-20131203/4703_1 /TAXON_ID=186043 /ORGANISM="Entomoneis sp., Strain CCMP2396" /LENGTH=504 /DNA_ID=CAMNT_0043804645 /DNA_START=97 /DNA_END=1611 /DNA_ORIENTATION=+
MKFSFAAVFAAVGIADAKRINPAQKKRNLLRKAVPVNADGTRRQLNAEFAISGYDVIKFNDCLSLTWQNEDALDDSLYSLTASGIVTPQTSYAVFQILNAYNMNGSDDLWMLPLADWVEATASSEQQEQEEYCNACEESYDYCYPEDDAEEEDDAEDGDENDRKRKLKKRKLTAKVVAHRDSMSAIMGTRRQLNGECVEYVNCYTCDSNGCFEDEDDEDENENDNICDEDAYVSGCTIDDEDVQDFMEDAACRDTGIVEVNANGDELGLSAGLMCNSDGSGVEMAIFADEDCSLYYSNHAFKSDLEGTFLYALLNETATSIMKPYISAIDCMACEYVALGQDDDDEEEEDNGEGPEASETCQNIMDEAVDIATCAGAEQEYNNNQDEDEDGDGDYAYPAVWSTYDFTDGEEPDADDVCFYVQTLNGDFESSHVYNSDESAGSGMFFDYSAAKNGGKSGSAAKTFGIIVGVAVVVVAGVMIMQKFASKRDSKKVPLVGNQKGALA